MVIIKPTQGERVHLAYLRGCQTTAEVAKETGIDRGTVYKHTGALVKEGYMRKVALEGGAVGYERNVRER